MSKKKQSTNKNTQQVNRLKNIENREKTKNAEDQNLNFISYYEQYDSQFDSFDNNYVAILEQNNSNTIAPQNINMLNGRRKKH